MISNSRNTHIQTNEHKKRIHIMDFDFSNAKPMEIIKASRGTRSSEYDTLHTGINKVFRTDMLAEYLTLDTESDKVQVRPLGPIPVPKLLDKNTGEPVGQAQFVARLNARFSHLRLKAKSPDGDFTSDTVGDDFFRVNPSASFISAVNAAYNRAKHVLSDDGTYETDSEIPAYLSGVLVANSEMRELAESYAYFV